MADLDDFFAKKDKKKKGGKKFSKANTDVLAKNLVERDLKRAEDEKKAYTIPDKEKDEKDVTPDPNGTSSNNVAANLISGVSNSNSTSNPLGLGSQDGYKSFGLKDNIQMNDDEWLNYEDEKKDYSGLKIESLKIDSENVSEEDNDHDQEEIINEEGEKVKVKKSDGGPWNKNVAAGGSDGAESANTSSSSDASHLPEPAAPAAPAASAQPKKYVPPSVLRNQQQQRPMSHMGGPKRRQQPIDINNEVLFPSLGGSQQEMDRGRKGTGRADGFEEVRSGGTGQQGQRGGPGQRVELRNTFSALNRDRE